MSTTTTPRDSTTDERLDSGAGISRLTSPQLVGRDREFLSLASILARSPAIVVVQGEAGVGKTRLISEALALLDPPRPVLLGSGQPLTDPFSLGPVIDALRAIPELLGPRPELPPMTGVLRPFFPDMGGILPPAPKAIGDPGAERHRIFRAFSELIAATEPVVLVLEDLHWADSNTCDFITFIASNLPRRTTLVLTLRSEEVSGSPFMKTLAHVERSADLHLQLEPLDDSGLAKLVCSILGAERVSEEFTSFLLDKTAGIPFAVEELLRLLQERRDLIIRDNRWARRTLDHVEVPGAIRDHVVERVGHLDEQARTVAQAVAVFGTPLAPSALSDLTGLAPEAASTALAEALDAVLLFELADGSCDFRHALARQAVYESIPLTTRTALHLRVADHLETSPAAVPSSQIAHHYRKGGDVDAWVAHAEAAADHASGIYDDAQAVHYLTEIVGCSEIDRSTRTRIAIKYGEAAIQSLAHDDAIAVIENLLASGEVDVDRRGELVYKLGLLLMQSGKTEQGAKTIEEALPWLDRKNPELAVRALAGLAVPDVAGPAVSQHRSWLERALSNIGDCRDPVIRAAVGADSTVALLCIGDERWRDGAARLPLQAEGDTAREAVRGCRNLVNIATYLGHYAEAQAMLEQGLAVSDRLDYARFVKMFEAAGLRIDWLTGLWDGLDERSAGLTEERVAYSFADAKLVSGALLLSRGQISDGLELLTAAAHEARITDDVPAIADTGGMLTRALMIAERPKEAIRVSQDALKVVTDKGIWTWAGILAAEAASAFVRHDRIEDLRSLASTMAEGLEGCDAPAASGSLEECRAFVAASEDDREASAAHFQRAETLWLALPNPYRAASVKEAWGTLLLERDGEAGRERLAGALELFQGLGATFDAARVRLALRRAGAPAPIPWRGGRRGYGDELSPREREAAELAVKGYTNKEIGEALFLSPRTVAHHLSSAMHKLGVESRRELRNSLLPE